MDVFVARQPIFNRNKEVIAYELLYRNSFKNFFDNSISSSKATSILIANSHINIGMNNLVQDKYAFINFDSELISNEAPSLLDKNKVVIEILETVEPDRQFISILLDLKKQGYILALDDFTLDYKYMDTLPIYDIIKVDFMLCGLEDAKKIIQKYSNGKRKFLAEKIETIREFQLALNMGYDFFQGFFFSRPEIIKGSSPNTINLQYIKLQEEFSKDKIDFNKVAEIIENDIGISYKFLKLINSFSHNTKFTSIREALNMLSAKEIEKWISFMMVSDYNSEKTSEVIKLCVVRSRFCELICKQSSYEHLKYQASLVGLFSMIDVVLEMPFEKIFKEIAMQQDIKDALLLKKGSILYEILQVVTSYEKANWNILDESCKKIGIKPNILPQLYFESVERANEVLFTFDSKK